MKHVIRFLKNQRNQGYFISMVMSILLIAFLAVFCLVYATFDSWLLRWGVGALLGIFELLQIKKRKVLI